MGGNLGGLGPGVTAPLLAVLAGRRVLGPK
jgi:hypothetical protein